MDETIKFISAAISGAAVIIVAAFKWVEARDAKRDEKTEARFRALEANNQRLEAQAKEAVRHIVAALEMLAEVPQGETHGRIAREIKAAIEALQ